jgi:hypothetical protein
MWMGREEGGGRLPGLLRGLPGRTAPVMPGQNTAAASVLLVCCCLACDFAKSSLSWGIAGCSTTCSGAGRGRAGHS